MNDPLTEPGAPDGGFVLLAVILLILLVTLATGWFLTSAHTAMAATEGWEDYDQSLLDAQSAVERVKYETYQAFLTNSTSGSDLAWFSTWSSNSIGTNSAYRFPAPWQIQDSTVSVSCIGMVVTNDGTSTYAEITFLSQAVHRYTRRLQERMRATASGTPIFDYAHLVEHGLTLAGGSLTVNGDVRSNGKITFTTSPYVNGTATATGTFTGTRRTRTLAAYFTSATTRSRPGDPTSTGGTRWTMGYDPAAATNRLAAPALTLPVIGVISQYVAMAVSHNGRISQNGSNLVTGVYTGPGPDGVAGTADDGCLVLNGSNGTLSISGPVVVAGDVIIRGKVTGQGCLYAGRNIHIVGDLVYTNAPAWPKPDTNPNATATANRTDDLLVLVAKGNIVIGNYTTTAWSNAVWSLMTAATNAAAGPSDSSDAPLGYDSDNNPANGYRFDGRYHVNEPNGGRRLSGVGTNTTPRKFFESSLANATVTAVSDAAVLTVDAALYANHGVIGSFGATGKTALHNGAMVCRDELVAFTGSLTYNWDIRLGSKATDRIVMDYTPAGFGTGTAITRTWREAR